MYHVNNEKVKMTYDGRNRMTNSRQNQNGNLQIFGNIGSRYH